MRSLRIFGRVMLAVMMACVMLAPSAMAADGEYTFSLNSSGDGYIVTGYSGSDAALTVPDWHGYLPVTEIGSSAFEGNTAIKSVSLPSTIVRIGAAAFKNCSSLSKLTTYTASSVPPRFPGDVDQNGQVDAHDALLVLQHNAGWSVSLNESHADVNASGGVDMEDALLIFQYGAGENVTLQ